MISIFYISLSILAGLAFIVGHRKAKRICGAGLPKCHSRPFYHATSLSVFTAGPAFLAVLIWYFSQGYMINTLVASQLSDTLANYDAQQLRIFLRDANALAANGISGNTTPLAEKASELISTYQTFSERLLAMICLILVSLGFVTGLRRIRTHTRARHLVERIITAVLVVSSTIAILTTIGIVLSLIFETFNFFAIVSIQDFLFGTHWSPQGAFEGAGQANKNTDYSMVFGAIPLFSGTLLITAIAMSVAAPIGLMAAIYLSDYASNTFRSIAKPMLEVLAGIPTVVYGFFAALTVAPLIRGWGEAIGLSVASESALAAGLVMGIMIIPFVSSLSDDVINSVPQSLRDGSYALGATKSETVRNVVIPAAFPGVVSALLLAVSRAIGETMIVVMAAGLAANLTINPLEAVTTVTVQIVTLLVGDQEFDSAKTLAAFALGLVLFCITLTLNVIALRIVNKYREQYE